MRALKVLVVVMGALLVGGTVALIMAIVVRVERRAALAPPAAPASHRVVLPPASRIIATTLAGERLLVRLALADGGEELVLFDACSGAEVAVIELPAAAGAAKPPR